MTKDIDLTELAHRLLGKEVKPARFLESAVHLTRQERQALADLAREAASAPTPANIQSSPMGSYPQPTYSPDSLMWPSAQPYEGQCGCSNSMIERPFSDFTCGSCGAIHKSAETVIAERKALGTLFAAAPAMLKALERIAYSAHADTAPVLRGYAQEAIAAAKGVMP